MRPGNDSYSLLTELPIKNRQRWVVEYYSRYRQSWASLYAKYKRTIDCDIYPSREDNSNNKLAFKKIYYWWFTNTCIFPASLVCAFQTGKRMWENDEPRSNKRFNNVSSECSRILVIACKANSKHLMHKKRLKQSMLSIQSSSSFDF